jgi:hypothetical protein
MAWWRNGVMVKAKNILSYILPFIFSQYATTPVLQFSVQDFVEMRKF